MAEARAAHYFWFD
jgi:FixJ family two-component response regulator